LGEEDYEETNEDRVNKVNDKGKLMLNKTSKKMTTLAEI